MGDITATIIASVLASNALFAFIQFMIGRADSAKNVKGKLTLLEKDVLRTQLLLLILMKPEEKQEIMTIGEHYFKILKGNWYMTSIFNKWLEEYTDGVRPEWFGDQGGGRKC